ncbi:PilZ domain-containing protein [Candidatus Liberibacter sp.]|uniref:PilZ domain-containing protein n=1 Tax=Candidatus Liberibacter sp. TaxID=34022 RepID=UPI0015F3ACBE|nr:PilZ domain-containing protein [Candidatus Liberibacter sp.]MBA5723855.1 PilZ domain-containing protein [Candidatus Liberibacter sp.]
MYRSIRNLQFIDQRAFQRMKVDLRGLFLLFNGEEHECRVREVSPGGLCFSYDNVGIKIGERIIVFIEQIGRVEGKVINCDSKRGCVVRIITSEHNRQKLAEKLIWLSNKDDLNLTDYRQHVRGVCWEVYGELVLEDDSVHPCKVIDISVSGVSVNVAPQPEISSTVLFNNIHGRVVRHFPGGVAVEFSVIQEKETLGGFF